MLNFIEHLNFSPKNKFFFFHFSKDTCFKEKYKICSLTLKNIPLAYKLINLVLSRISKHKRKKSDISYCPYLETIMHSTYKGGSSILIYKHSCNHYSFMDGRHRTCIAARKNMTIPTNIKKLDTLCPYCKNKLRNNRTTSLKLTKF